MVGFDPLGAVSDVSVIAANASTAIVKQVMIRFLFLMIKGI